MGMLKEFQNFAIKGNALDLAIGVIVGGAFGKITTSLVNDVITPPLGLLLGGVDFSQLSITLKEAKGEIASVTLNYGAFLQTIFDFIIIAFAMFLVIRTFNRLKRVAEELEEPKPIAPPPPPPPAPEPVVIEPVLTETEKLLVEIRDLLKK